MTILTDVTAPEALALPYHTTRQRANTLYPTNDDVDEPRLSLCLLAVNKNQYQRQATISGKLIQNLS